MTRTEPETGTTWTASSSADLLHPLRLGHNSARRSSLSTARTAMSRIALFPNDVPKREAMPPSNVERRTSNVAQFSFERFKRFEP